MKKLLLLLLFIPLVSFGQTLDAYKYVYVPDLRYENGIDDQYGLSAEVRETFRMNGVFPINDDQIEEFYSQRDPCTLIKVSQMKHLPKGRWKHTVEIELSNCLGKVIFTGSANAGNDMSSPDRDIRVAGAKIINKVMKNHNFNSSLTPELPDLKSSLIGSKFDFDINSEKSVREYFDRNGTDLIEGIWGYDSSNNQMSDYKLLILKDDFIYKAIIFEGSGLWAKGDLKAEFEPAAVDEIMTVKWTMGDKIDIKKVVATVKNNALIEFDLGGKTQLYKIYPKLNSKKRSKNNLRKGEWAGNGSGIIISKSGYIITNHHVIEDADDIEVEFILNDEVQKFNAEIVQVDKTNDLAILKIFDMNFDGVGELPYNFKTRSSDVGTKVYAFGYPMALSIMGKEIKVTDGMISSKTGFDGNITTYQITAPIQGGNSGGPLFDEKGNLIGINSSGIRKDVADNVAYSIKTSYVLNLIDILPKSIELPSNTKLESLPLTEQIKEISKYVVLIKVK